MQRLPSLALALALALVPTPARAALQPMVSHVALPGSGASLYGMQDARLPRVWYHMYLDAGERYQAANAQGVVSAAAELLARGPANIPYDRYKRDLFRAGTEIRWEPGNRFLLVHVKCAPDQLKHATELVVAAARHPRLDPASVSEALSVVLNQRKAMNDNMSQVVFHYGKQKLWDFKPPSRQPEAWVETLGHLQARDMAAYFQDELAHPAGFVASVAPVPSAQVARAIAPALAGWLKPDTIVRATYPVNLPSLRVVLIDKPGATDNQIYALSPLPVTPGTPAAAAAEVFFAGLGFDLGARLGDTLRVKRGLTYGANSGVRRVEWPQWYAYSFGGIAQTPKIVSGLFELFGAAKSGLSAGEVAIAKSKLLQAAAADLESPTQQLDAVAAAVAQGLPPDTPFVRPLQIAHVTPALANAVAGLAAGLPHATIIIMGDAAKLEQPLKQALPAGTPLEVRTLADLGPEALRAPAATP